MTRLAGSTASEYVPISMVCTHSNVFIACRCGETFRASGKPQYVKRKQRKWEAMHTDCIEVKREGEKVFWLSFCDGERPKGQQFLGACVVKVDAKEADDAALTLLLWYPMAEPGSEWLAAAIAKSHLLGCNPGGEVASREMPSEHPNLAFYQFGVLMDRATIKAIDKRIKEAPAADAVDPQAGGTTE